MDFTFTEEDFAPKSKFDFNEDDFVKPRVSPPPEDAFTRFSRAQGGPQTMAEFMPGYMKEREATGTSTPLLTRPLALVPHPSQETIKKFLTVPEIQGDVETVVQTPEGPSAVVQRQPEIKQIAPSPKSVAVAAGVTHAGADMASFFTSPLGILTLGIGGLPAIAQRTIALGFAAQMAKDVPEIAKQLGEELGKPEDKRDYEKISKLSTEAIANTAFVAGGIKHGLAEPVAGILGALPTERLPITPGQLAEQSFREQPKTVTEPVTQAERTEDARSIEETSPVYETLLRESERRSEQVPAEESGKGVPAPKKEVEEVTAELVSKMTPIEFNQFAGNNPTGKGYELAKQLGTEADRSALDAGEKSAVEELSSSMTKMREATPEQREKLFNDAQLINGKKQYFNEAKRMLSAMDDVKAGKSVAEAARERGVAEEALSDAVKTKEPSPPEPSQPAVAQTPRVEQPKPVSPKSQSEQLEDRPVTSIKNAVVDQERAKRGLPKAMEPASREFGSVWDEAMDIAEKNPTRQQELIDELRENPRALTDTEDALLLHRQIELQNEYQKSVNDLNTATDRGDVDAIQSARLRGAKLEDDLLDIYDIGKKVGTETGRGLNARKMLAEEDFSLASMVAKKRAANGGQRLNPEQTKEIERLQKVIETTQKAFDDYISKASEREANKVIDEIVKDVAKSKDKPKSKTKGLAERIVLTLEKEADAAKQRLRERLARTSAGVDPTILYDVGVIGAAKLARGVVDFAKWSSEMATEIGDWIKPHINEYWEASQGEFRKRTVDDISSRIQTKFSSGNTDVSGLVQRLARTFVESGITERNGLIDAVHTVLKQIDPNITRREAMDAISGYGKYRQLTKDDVSIKLRDAKGQMQQVAKLEDMQRGKAPLKTGAERRVPSQEERDLIKKVNEAKKKGGFNVVDPATQLKSSLDSIKTRLRNQISDLERQIKSRERIIKQKTPAPTDPEVESLRKQRDQLQSQFDEIFQSPGLTDSQRVARATKALERSIEDLAERIKKKDISPKISKTPVTPELQALRAKHAAMREELQLIRDADEGVKAKRLEAAAIAARERLSELERRINEGDIAARQKPKGQPSPELDRLRNEAGDLRKILSQLQRAAKPKKDPAAIALQAYKTRLAKMAADYHERLADEDFAPRKRKTIELDKEAQALKAKAENAKLEFHRGLIKDRLANRSLFERIADRFVKVRRAFILSSPVTLAKLTAAAIERGVITPTEEVIGGALSKFPGISKVAARAPREGGFSLRAESKAITDTFTKGMSDAWQTLKKGRSDLEAVYGKERFEPRTWEDFIGEIHGALKSPTKRNEFSRSFQKRVENAVIQGIDATDPAVQSRIAIEAYKDANRSIFLQDNRVVSAYKRAISALEQPSKETGKVPVSAKALATTAKFLLPIVKVPTNIVAETLQYSTGLVTGSVNLGKALRVGVETLPPEQADLIMRQLKKGSLGGAMLLTGFLLPNLVGGYYQQREKRRPGEPKAGTVMIGDTQIPSALLHNPLLETLQIGSTIRRVSESKLRKKDAENQGITAGVMAGALGLGEEVPFVREMSDVSKAFDSNQRGAFFGELGKSTVVPQLFQTWARWKDVDAMGETIRRNPQDIWEHIETGIPGLREEVPVKRNK